MALSLEPKQIDELIAFEILEPHPMAEVAEMLKGFFGVAAQEQGDRMTPNEQARTFASWFGR